MVLILFRPFDPVKWLVVAFSAFLAGLLNGGNGGTRFNYNGNNFSTQQQQFHQQFGHFTSAFGALQIGSIIFIAGLILLFVIALVVLFTWLGARGQFLFLDNIVRNRGAIAAPWHAYAQPANRVFLFQLLCTALALGLVVIFAVPAVLLVLSVFFRASTHFPLVPEFPAVLGLISLGLVYFAVSVAVAAFLFLFREWGIALMFRHPITVRAALEQTWALIRLNPGSVSVFILLRLALWVGLIVVALLLCCVCCCVAFLPYVSSVLLLPVLVFTRCFSLECLAQFGPAYDVFTVDLPPDSTPIAPSPLPPLG